MRILIVGSGFAGSLLAWFLTREGADVTVIDRGEPDSSTRVSAGIMLPVTGRRLVKTQNADQAIPFAETTYHDIENLSGMKFFNLKNVLQLFQSVGNRNDWYARSTDSDLSGFTGALLNPNEIHSSIRNRFGGIVLRKSGSVDPQTLLTAIRKCLSGKANFIQGQMVFESIRVNNDSIEWCGTKYSYLILCQGYESTINPFSEWIPFKPVKGEILDFYAPELDDRYIICNSKYILPLGNGNFRIGSTYEWNELNTIPTPEARTLLIDALNQTINCNYSITGHKAGIRPAVIDRRPVIGLHPKYKRIGVLNGLGTKGAMQGPFYAKQACDFLLKGKGVDKDVDLMRFSLLSTKL